MGNKQEKQDNVGPCDTLAADEEGCSGNVLVLEEKIDRLLERIDEHIESSHVQILLKPYWVMWK